MKNYCLSMHIVVVIIVFTFAPLAFAQDTENSIPEHTEESRNMSLLGYHDLQGRPAYQPVIEQHNGKWIAYVGLMGGEAPNVVTGEVELNGTLLVDVTDPANPFTLAHIPGGSVTQGSGGNGAQMSRVCNRNDTAYLLRSFGSSSHQVWDVSSPSEPAFVDNVADDLKSVHKSWWECDSGIAYIVGQDEDWRSRHTSIYDLSDPEHPVFIRAYGIPGQEPGAEIEPVPTNLHGPIALGNRVYFGYGSSRDGIIQIVDRDKLLKGGPEASAGSFEAAEIARYYLAPNYGAHTTLPVLGVNITDYKDNVTGATRDFLIVPSESTRNECFEERDAMFIFDITYPEKPMPVSSYQVREADGDFCQRGGRFGPHAVDESMHPAYYGKLVFLSYFNAGVRAIDIRNPYEPREVGFYIPATNANTTPSCLLVNDKPRCKTAVQTNNVEIDARGLIYIVDRVGTGMHILTLTGEAQAVVTQLQN